VSGFLGCPAQGFESGQASIRKINNRLEIINSWIVFSNGKKYQSYFLKFKNKFVDTSDSQDGFEKTIQKIRDCENEDCVFLKIEDKYKKYFKKRWFKRKCSAPPSRRQRLPTDSEFERLVDLTLKEFDSPDFFKNNIKSILKSAKNKVFERLKECNPGEVIKGHANGFKFEGTCGGENLTITHNFFVDYKFEKRGNLLKSILKKGDIKVLISGHYVIDEYPHMCLKNDLKNGIYRSSYRIYIDKEHEFKN
jgi:hypothetical protein